MLLEHDGPCCTHKLKSNLTKEKCKKGYSRADFIAFLNLRPTQRQLMDYLRKLLSIIRLQEFEPFTCEKRDAGHVGRRTGFIDSTVL